MIRTRITRRHFLQQASAFAAGPLVGGQRLFAGPSAPDDALYQFAVLGDMHIDAWGHHDMDWVRREKPADITQIEDYVETTALYTPRLLEAVHHSILHCQTPFAHVIQLGDFGEGLCGNCELQVRQFRDAIQLVRSHLPDVPFGVTKGNHDITGPGAEEAYDQIILPWLAAQNGRDGLSSASFVREYQEDLFIFFDAYKPDLDWLETVLQRKPWRHVFLAIHPPVIPYNARSNWHIFSRPDDREKRERLLMLLGKYSVLVLSGHLHHFALLSRQTPAGPFAQLGLSSVIRSEKSPIKAVLEGRQNYGPQLVDQEPSFSPDTRELRQKLLEDESAHIRSFESAAMAGYATIIVYADRLAINIFNGFEQQPLKSYATSKTACLPRAL